MSYICPSQTDKVLDVGFTKVEFSPTDNYIEKHYPYPDKLVALGIEHAEEFELRYPLVKTVYYDGGGFPFADGEFDVCWSNAVLEHVGDHQRQVAFLEEIVRVSRRIMITTPNRGFPVEVHTRTLLLHHLPRRFFNRCLEAIGKGWAAGEYMHLLGERELRLVLADAGIDDYRILKSRLWGFTLEFVVIAMSPHPE